jgi:hypothetical protein
MNDETSYRDILQIDRIERTPLYWQIYQLSSRDCLRRAIGRRRRGEHSRRFITS